MMPALSVILCTHNPRPDYLQRTLAALRVQSTTPSAFDLIVVDNASREPVAGRFDLSWHPTARIVVETSPGLTAARLRGISESTTALLLFVDDDNLLAPDYLAEATAFADSAPSIGVWGCGSFTPEWEEPPATEVAPFLRFLAVHQSASDRLTHRLYDYDATPPGAGMCVRRAVATRYAELTRQDPLRRSLDRTGAGLSGCGDFDLAFTAIDLGLGSAVLRRLKITHLMPTERVQLNYLVRLAEGHGYSSFILHQYRDARHPPRPPNLLDQIRHWRYLRSLPAAERAVAAALRAGAERARRDLSCLSRS